MDIEYEFLTMKPWNVVMEICQLIRGQNKWPKI